VKLSTWLRENLHSHDVVKSETFRKALVEATGCDAEWETTSYEEMKGRIEGYKWGGEVGPPTGERCADALNIVEALAKKYVPSYRGGSPYLGKGRQFKHMLEVLKRAGL
jgi:hypothetical protein